ncbi:bifunctional methylenetetrahydrofolate dehydrogenase/methenyltetrahydrofolate cyclohydrolase FolD [Buchnera aphidicola]|uniref:Bifunctional protein FolD n=1 Tax=Buchnera aphidicola subsp. Cinara cedri (strain Cc) TaxID=372461 RepID=FOLD_BUCCC|nr:bifunctional methylenetetrahydrofolate dehydrogenase/methenyltetrahydrofolate cyclohydrolase FolD [Buchnera aphidicola]Q057D7.1 RecName: Full=Bifunctional protein FolD; Includes: RecName: Full=Methylenetetrahydrofolate dehydrogenase; Includes: RecName: Full=Methenyltetrahydrofolate cyclohydrolase [Buchnera aphidicola BCc]ABJ90762.1 5,10-methylene-tetrahydrofolate dehydrogenase [Buchnera aphidicola BCc]
METKILDGLKISKKIIKKIKKKIEKRKKKRKKIPGLAMIVIGNNPASLIYVNKKREACNQAGFFSIYWHLSNQIEEIELINLIKKLNKNKCIDGILIQLPLPIKINYLKIITSIDPKKDVDGFHPYNLGSLCQNNPQFRSCTSKGVITLLKKYKINIHGLYAVIIGSSNIVGKPMYMELLLAGCTVTIVNKNTKNIKTYVKKADLVVIAIGQPNFLYGHWIKLGAIVIDIGINYLYNKNKYKIVGDVHFKSTSVKTSYITPVPGGVGPMTVVSLLENTLQACIM